MAPPGASIDANIRTTIQDSSPIAPKNWMAKVGPAGIWDYHGKTGNDAWLHFTQLNYGATGRVFYPAEVLLRMAGLLQMVSDTANNPPMGQGNPFGERPYGDDPEDTAYIELGILYYESNYLMQASASGETSQ